MTPQNSSTDSLATQYSTVSTSDLSQQQASQPPDTTTGNPKGLSQETRMLAKQVLNVKNHPSLDSNSGLMDGGLPWLLKAAAECEGLITGPLDQSRPPKVAEGSGLHGDINKTTEPGRVEDIWKLSTKPPQ